MPEKRKTRGSGGRGKVQTVTPQATLKDLFQRTNSGTAPTGKTQDLHVDHTDLVTPSSQPADSQPLSQSSRPPKPTRLFPIFTTTSSVREKQPDRVIDIDDTEVIDITDASSDADLSTMEPPPPSTRHLSPRSEFSQATSRSPSPSLTALDTHRCENDTSLSHAVRPRVYTHPQTTNQKKPVLGDVGPLPSSCSQHVRGVQHTYTSGKVPIKRSLFLRCRPSVQGTLDFLAKGWQLNISPSTLWDPTHPSLTPEQCEEHLQSLGREYSESHPAFTKISIRREISLRHAETWTRRFRPRRANEVLGNERHALYLRDWLRALELQSRDRQPKDLVSKSATSREKDTSKRAEPRGVKRPRVIRAVNRKRGNKKRRIDSDDDLDDFVVFSDEAEEVLDNAPEDEEDEVAFCERSLARLHRRDATNSMSATQESTRTNFNDHLTNTLLITGPPGCGKTAAVYACAEELGWDVFEVYPGIGKRSGANLDHLVGDVGRNHMVQTVHRCASMKTTKLGTKDATGLGGYLARSKTGRFGGIAELQEAGTSRQPISVEAESPTEGVQQLPPDEHMDVSDGVAISEICHAGFDGSRRNVRQSLVLLEEVDILFKEDVGFWPAVVEFIRRCQRPVIMTCNDPGLVPVTDLPLQAVLAFEPCPSPVAATFLQCLSLSEGWLVPHEDLMVLYERRHSIDGLDVPDGPHYPRTEPLPLPDLRRSISQLQMVCAGAKHGSTSEMHQGDEAKGHVRRSGRAISAECRVGTMEKTVERELWRQMKRQSELMSHVDVELSRKAAMDTREVNLRRNWCFEELTETWTQVEVGREGKWEEEEMGYVTLRERREGQGYCQHDELIAEEAIRHSRGVHEEVATDPIEASINPAARLTREDARWFRARVEYQTRMVDALQEMVVPPAPLVPQKSVFLDYIPWVRYMVTVDDILERRAWDGMGRGRSTRNSMRTGHARTVGVSSRQQAMLRESRLDGGVDWGSPE